MKSIETVKAEKKLKNIKNNSFSIPQMIGRKFAVISNELSSTDLSDNLKYKTFEREDADKLIEGKSHRLVGYISSSLMNKMYKTQNLFTGNHIQVKDELNNVSYVFVDA